MTVSPAEPKAPVEGKVWASTVGAGGGYVVAKAILWLLGVVVWHVPFDGDHAIVAVEAVPGPVSAVLTWGLGVGAAFLAGYRARHTARISAPQPGPTDNGVTNVVTGDQDPVSLASEVARRSALNV